MERKNLADLREKIKLLINLLEKPESGELNYNGGERFFTSGRP